MIWSSAHHWSLRLGSALLFFILARILPPDQIGLYSAALAVIALMELFAENGLGDAIIQAPRVTDATLAAAFWFTTLLGCLSCGILWLLASTLETWLSAPGLAPVLSVLLLILPLNSMSYVPQAMLRRDLKYRQLAVRSLIATTLSSCLGLFLALIGAGIWSMVVQFIVFCIINFIILWRVRAVDVFARPDFASLMPLLRFGSQVFTSKFIYYVVNRSIEFVLLYKFGAVLLAYYIMGGRIVFVVNQLLLSVTSDVALTTFSRLADSREAIRKTFFSSLNFATFIAAPIYFGMASISSEFCILAFGENGENAAPFMTIISIIGGLQISQSFNGSLLYAAGRPSIPLLILVLQAIVTLFALLPPWGFAPESSVALYATAIIATMPIYAYACCKVIKIPILEYTKTISPYYISSLLMFGLIKLLPYIWGVFHQVQIFGIIINVIVGVTVYIGSLWVFAPLSLKSNLDKISATNYIAKFLFGRKQ